MKESGEGCDYTIGCGMNYEMVEAENEESLIEKIVFPDGEDEDSIFENTDLSKDVNKKYSPKYSPKYRTEFVVTKNNIIKTKFKGSLKFDNLENEILERVDNSPVSEYEVTSKILMSGKGNYSDYYFTLREWYITYYK